MKRLLSLFVLVSWVCVTAQARHIRYVEPDQPHPQHEIILNTSEANLDSLSFGSSTSLGFGVWYQYAVLPYLQLGAEVGVIYHEVGLGNVAGTNLSTSASLTAIEALGGAMVDLPFNWRLENAFFAGVYMGIVHASALGVSSTPFLLEFPVGKRFAVFPHVNYMPSFDLIVPTNGESVQATFKLLQVSITF